MLPVLALPTSAPNDALPADGNKLRRGGGAGPSDSDSLDSVIENLVLEVNNLESDTADTPSDVYRLLAVAGGLQRQIYGLLSDAKLSEAQRVRLRRLGARVEAVETRLDPDVTQAPLGVYMESPPRSPLEDEEREEEEVLQSGMTDVDYGGDDDGLGPEGQSEYYIDYYDGDGDDGVRDQDTLSEADADPAPELASSSNVPAEPVPADPPSATELEPGGRDVQLGADADLLEEAEDIMEAEQTQDPTAPSRTRASRTGGTEEREKTLSEVLQRAYDILRKPAASGGDELRAELRRTLRTMESWALLYERAKRMTMALEAKLRRVGDEPKPIRVDDTVNDLTDSQLANGMWRVEKILRLEPDRDARGRRVWLVQFIDPNPEIVWPPEKTVLLLDAVVE